MFLGTLLLTLVAYGQEADTLMAKKPKQKGQFKTNWKLSYPNPYRAGVYSLILPSAGQFYNKRYWKMPIVWGGFYTLFYLVDYNKTNRDRFQTALGQRLLGVDDEFKDVIFNVEGLRRRRNYFDKNLQLTYIGFFGLYALTALDAYVDAHLKNFDIGDDLSFYITPDVRYGAGMTLRIILH